MKTEEVKELCHEKDGDLEPRTDPNAAALVSLIGEDEGLACYVTTETPVFNCGCNMQYAIIPAGIPADRLDIASCLEDTLRRMLDAGWDDEKIFSVTGMRKVTNEEIDGDVENISVDLGYILPGSLLQWKSEVR